MEQNLNVENNSGIIAGRIDNVVIAPNTIRQSILSEFIIEMLNNNIETVEIPSIVPYTVEDKIKYNNIVKYKGIVDKYYAYSAICDSILNKLDDIKAGDKKKVLNYVKTTYLLIKGSFLRANGNSFLTEIDVIKNHSDDIIDEIIKKFFDDSKNTITLQKYNIEEIEINIIAFIIYCFVECMILERPIQNGEAK